MHLIKYDIRRNLLPREGLLCVPYFVRYVLIRVTLTHLYQFVLKLLLITLDRLQ